MSVIATRLTCAALLIIAAACDIRTFRIPNPIPLSLAGLFAVSAILGVQGDLVPHAISFAIAGGLSLLLFLGNIWGGGDTKLTGALALFLQPGDLTRFFVVTSLAGGLLALTILILRSRSATPVTRGTAMPYGVALAAGGLDWCMSF